MFATISNIDILQKLVHLDSGEALPITNFFNSDGEDCDSFEAVACVAGTDDFGWITIDISDLRGTIH